MGLSSEPRKAAKGSWVFLHPIAILCLGMFSLFFAFGFARRGQAQWALTHPKQLDELLGNKAGGREYSEDTHKVLEESLDLIRDILNDIATRGHSSWKTGNDGELDINKLSTRDLASAFSDIFNGIAGGIAGGIGNGITGASMYLGAGIGNGTLQGLNLSPAVRKPNTVIAAPSGINAAAESLGMGLSASIVGSLNLSMLLPSNPGAINTATLALSQGLGSGAAAGLNLKPIDKAAFNTSGLNGVVGTLGQGLTSSFLGGVSVTKLLGSLGGNMTTAQANQAVLSLAQGLGSGASAGLDLKPIDKAAFDTTGLSGLAGNLGQGLTSSFLGGVPVRKLLGSVGGNVTSAQANQAALSLAQGLGSGASAALDLKPVDKAAFDTTGLSGVAGNLGQGLSSSFLGGVSVMKLLGSAGGNITTAQANQAALSLAQGLGNGASSALKLTTNSAGSPPPFNTDGLSGIAGNIGQGLSTSFLGNVDIKQLLPGNATSAQANQAALSLAQGLGSGASSALNLTTKSAGTPPPFNTDGISGIAGNIGQGLSTSFLGNVDIKQLLPNIGGNITTAQVNQAALSLAQGLGSGASSALKLTTKSANNPPFNTDGVSGIAGNIGQGLSTSFLGNVDINQLLPSIGGNITAAQANQAALSLAQGLGSGASSALKLTTKVASNAFNTDGLSGIAGNIGQGLSTSFLGNVDVNQLLPSTGSLSGFMLMTAVKGLGSGLGEGAVVGLGIQPEGSMTKSLAAMNSSAPPDIGGIVQMFGLGLSESFLSNDTLTKTLKLVGGNSAMMSSFNTIKVAEGLGIGLIDGVQQSIEIAGGIGGILNLSPAAVIGMMPMPTSSTFDDSVGGVATGLGNGLGFEVAKGLLQALGKPPLRPNSVPGTPAGASSNSSFSTTIAIKALNVQNRPKRSIPVLYKRANASATTLPAKLDTLLSATTLDPILQLGSVALGCQGIGGLAAILQSLASSKVFSGGKLSNLTSALGLLTNQTYTVQDHNGNTFTVNIGEAFLTVNGNSLVSEFKLIIIHLAFASLGYVIAIPTIIMLNSARNFAVMTGRFNLLVNVPRWQWLIGLLILLPAMVVTLVLGILAEGKRSHFYSAHSIMGLILIILTLIGAPLAFYRAKIPQINLVNKLNLTIVTALSIFVIITGFVDLATISSCLFQFLPQVIFVIAGFLFAIPIFSVTTMVLMEMAFQKWLVGQRPGDSKMAMGMTGAKTEKVKEGKLSISKPFNGGRMV